MGDTPIRFLWMKVEIWSKITALITLVGQGLQKLEREKAIGFSPSPATRPSSSTQAFPFYCWSSASWKSYSQTKKNAGETQDFFCRQKCSAEGTTTLHFPSCTAILSPRSFSGTLGGALTTGFSHPAKRKRGFSWQFWDLPKPTLIWNILRAYYLWMGRKLTQL